MKCQKCEKPATFHITDLTGDEGILALHLCPECAKQFLEQPEKKSPSATPTLSGLLSQQLKLGQTAEELAKLDKRECPICGTSFFEFRQSGRLGCPHDYLFFANELEPLIASIHGKIEHIGKRPKRGTQDSELQTELIRLRREMKDAINSEDYELASSLRDKIRRIEQGELQ
ncbi:MAG TPA: UvrB/UvrC motif-containing protein [Pirellulaceae bacterium]|nr:UvrB/UvrC motif-containing protein [Pirellulaceae bacterium]HMO92912.1 UvrB/UvrC motif-containing protein [Pirellulaceae bacterium]HMP69190.1 UvrB/UvrC motif-containing protein [Pirellulaceae bacterium]